jgi:6-phospho-beta-glucosidase
VPAHGGKSRRSDESLQNAGSPRRAGRGDFVTTQLRVGQLKAREKDERIPLSHGYLGQETNGAGGLFKGLRTIPVIFDIVKDVQEICPDAWIINFTNPAGW